MNKDQEQPLDPEYEDELTPEQVELRDILRDIALTQSIDEMLDKWRLRDEKQKDE